MPLSGRQKEDFVPAAHITSLALISGLGTQEEATISIVGFAPLFIAVAFVVLVLNTGKRIGPRETTSLQAPQGGESQEGRPSLVPTIRTYLRVQAVNATPRPMLVMVP
jgi:hypothetical protein